MVIGVRRAMCFVSDSYVHVVGNVTHLELLHGLGGCQNLVRAHEIIHIGLLRVVELEVPYTLGSLVTSKALLVGLIG
jgi:hypothetical protein